MQNPEENPLVFPIRKILLTANRALTEHELIKLLQENDEVFPVLADSERLALFQTHFLVMNALYQLQSSLLEEGFYLHISPLEIGLQLSSDGAGKNLSNQEDSNTLKEYYGDWGYFDNANEQSVEALLSEFWSYYLAADKQADAYRILQLEPEAEWEMVRSAYRSLAAEHHPDRGGDATEFMLIREAYEVLKKAGNH